MTQQQQNRQDRLVSFEQKLDLILGKLEKVDEIHAWVQQQKELAAPTTPNQDLPVILRPIDPATGKNFSQLSRPLVKRALVDLLAPVSDNLDTSQSVSHKDDGEPARQGVSSSDWQKAGILYEMIRTCTSSVVTDARKDPSFRKAYSDLDRNQKADLIGRLHTYTRIRNVFLDRAVGDWLANHFLLNKVRAIQPQPVSHCFYGHAQNSHSLYLYYIRNLPKWSQAPSVRKVLRMKRYFILVYHVKRSFTNVLFYFYFD